MKLDIVKGATSVLCRIFIQDSTSTTGAGKTGLVFNTSGLTCYQMRDDDGNAGATAVALVTATLGTWTSKGFKEKDATNAPGWYEFGIPNAALATGSRSVGFHFQGATGMAPLAIEIELTGWDNQDGVHGGLSALPNTAVTTNASLLTSGTGTDQISVASGRIDAGKILGTAISAPATAGILDINVKNIVNVAAALDGNNRLKVDVDDWGGGAVPAPNVTGVPLIDLKYILGTVLTETAGLLAAGFKKFFNINSPTLTIGGTDQTGDNYARLGAPAGASIAADLAEIEAETDGIAAIPTTPVLTAHFDTVIGSPAGASIAADIAAIKSDTGTTLTDVNAGAGAIYTRIGAPAGASLAADVAAVKTDTAAIKAKTDNFPEGIKKNAALANFEFFMADSSDHVTGKTGLTVAVQASIDGGAFANVINTPATEVANGIYKISLAAADLNGTVITLKMSSAGADTTFVTIKTEL